MFADWMTMTHTFLKIKNRQTIANSFDLGNVMGIRYNDDMSSVIVKVSYNNVDRDYLVLGRDDINVLKTSGVAKDDKGRLILLMVLNELKEE